MNTCENCNQQTPERLRHTFYLRDGQPPISKLVCAECYAATVTAESPQEPQGGRSGDFSHPLVVDADGRRWARPTLFEEAI